MVYPGWYYSGIFQASVRPFAEKITGSWFCFCLCLSKVKPFFCIYYQVLQYAYKITSHNCFAMKLRIGLLPNTLNYGLRMRRECRERFLHQRLQGKPLVSDPGMHHGTCLTHLPWYMSGSLTRGDGKNFPGACANRNFTYLARGLCIPKFLHGLAGLANSFQTDE